MYCERCGAQLAEDSRFCASCGKPQGVVLVPALAGRGRVEQHVKTVAILWIVYGILCLGSTFAILAIGRVLATQIFVSSGVPYPFQQLAHSVLSLIGVWAGMKAVLALAGGWGMLERASWARPVTIVAAFLSLLSLPFGTALGIYSLWVLMPDESGREYDRLSLAA